MKLPLVRHPELFHVGTFDPSDKRDFSWEGPGLSVSRDPEEWERIAELGGCPWWRLENEDAAFLDFHELTQHQRQQIAAWGIDNGYVTREPRWSVSYYDDELEDTMSILCKTHAEALEERDGDESCIKSCTTLVSTPSLDERLGMKGGENALDFLTLCYVEDHAPNMDGVWWEDTYGPLSAPRGVIFTRRLERFRRSLLHDAPVLAS